LPLIFFLTEELIRKWKKSSYSSSWPYMYWW